MTAQMTTQEVIRKVQDFLLVRVFLAPERHEKPTTAVWKEIGEDVALYMMDLLYDPDDELLEAAREGVAKLLAGKSPSAAEARAYRELLRIPEDIAPPADERAKAFLGPSRPMLRLIKGGKS